MAGDAVVRADVEVFQIAHSGVDAIGMGEIGSRVTANPVLCGTMATFAGNPFGDVQRIRLEHCWNRLKWRVATRATGIFDR